MTHIKIGGREFALAFTLDGMDTLEKLMGGFDISKITDYTYSPKGLGDMVYAMAQQGELLEGRELDVDRAWIGSHLSPAPKKVLDTRLCILSCIEEAMRMESSGESEEVDVALAEIKKKENKAG